MNNWTNIFLEIIREHVRPGTPVSFESPLFAGGLELDSIAFLQLLLAIEERLGVRVRDEELTEEALSSVGSFLEHIAHRHGG